MNRIFAVLCVAAATITTPVAADTLTDVRNALSRLSGTKPVRGTFGIQQSVRADGRFSNSQTDRVASVLVAHDSSGLTITLPQNLIDRSAAETRSGGGDDSARSAIGAIKTNDVIEALHFRDALLGMLAGATVVDEKRAAWRDRPARLLLLKLNPKEKNEGNSIRIGSLKSEDSLNLWIGDDHLPLAADRVQKATAGFMFIKGTMESRLKYTFLQAGDRIILTRVEITDHGSGMGQKVAKTSLQTVTVH